MLLIKQDKGISNIGRVQVVSTYNERLLRAVTGTVVYAPEYVRYYDRHLPQKAPFTRLNQMLTAGSVEYRPIDGKTHVKAGDRVFFRFGATFNKSNGYLLVPFKLLVGVINGPMLNGNILIDRTGPTTGIVAATGIKVDKYMGEKLLPYDFKVGDEVKFLPKKATRLEVKGLETQFLRKVVVNAKYLI